MDYVISNLHWFVLLLGGLVFFHELGHFLVAKLCGVKVLRFSLGFGPKIVGFTYGETEYWLSLLPLRRQSQPPQCHPRGNPQRSTPPQRLAGPSPGRGSSRHRA